MIQPISTPSMPPSVTVIVPTYREVENMRDLIARIGDVREHSLPELDLIIVDDDSEDGIAALVESLSLPWLRLRIRRGARGLSTAVLEGLREAQGEVLVVMDGDLSHPVGRIPDLVARLEDGADFALGSRYAPGGTTDARWSIWRWLNSKVATVFARPFTRATDPMSGFFALRRETLESAAPLSPLGYKIGLELIVKCRCQRIDEVPIHFAERTRGRSKLTITQQWLYLRHVLRLLRWRLLHRQ